MATEVNPVSFQRMFKATFLIQNHLKKINSFPLFKYFTIVTQICICSRKEDQNRQIRLWFKFYSTPRYFKKLSWTEFESTTKRVLINWD